MDPDGLLTKSRDHHRRHPPCSKRVDGFNAPFTPEKILVRTMIWLNIRKVDTAN